MRLASRIFGRLRIPPRGTGGTARCARRGLRLGALGGIALALAPAASGAAGPASYSAAFAELVDLEDGHAGVTQLQAELAALEAEARASGVPLREWFFERARFAGTRVGSPSADPPTALEGVLARRGPCLVLAGVYLSLAERLGVDAVPVATPRHVFIREGGTGSGAPPPRNIELLERGAERTDASYLTQEKAPRDDPRSAQLLRVLTPEAFFVYLLNNHAVTLRAAGSAKAAARFYRRALRYDDDCQPCHFNLANLLAAEGRSDDAVRHYDRALALHPWDEEARGNRQLLRR